MLKQFIDLKNGEASSFFFFFPVVVILSVVVCFFFLSWHLLGHFPSALEVSVVFYCSLQRPVRSVQEMEEEDDESGHRVEECRRQCRVDFQFETLKT